ncbi:hypothetical protein MBANPS3_008459 [Mucor bainieri]
MARNRRRRNRPRSRSRTTRDTDAASAATPPPPPPNQAAAAAARQRRLVIKFLILVFYAAYHLISSCTTIERINNADFQDTYGVDVYRNVPDVVVIPRVHKSCLRASFTAHFIACTLVMIVMLYF